MFVTLVITTKRFEALVAEIIANLPYSVKKKPDQNVVAARLSAGP